MKKIIVVHPGSWILSIIAKKLCAAMPETFVEFDLRGLFRSPEDMEGFFYIDIQNCWSLAFKNQFPSVKHIGLFTHLDKDSPKSFRSHWDELDGVVHMCSRYYNMFNAAGWYTEKQMRVIPPGEYWPVNNPIQIGVCQRGGFVGKGDGFLQQSWNGLPKEIGEELHLTLKGSGWDIGKFTGSNWTLDVNEDYDSYGAFFNKIDYLLIPSLWEGGPISVIEALSWGKPLIAADVGWVNDFTEVDGWDTVPHSMWPNVIIEKYSTGYVFNPGDEAGLQLCLSHVAGEVIARRRLVRYMSYESFGDQVAHFFNETKKEI
ncbi:MAG: hypothetical protein KKD77_22935 [Gammaproteobacteria bacterium]|nr:hypothetical protein [Gammaproteobacteria bacterium]